MRFGISPRALACTVAVIGALTVPAIGQLAPDVHWGANAFPPVDPEFRLSLSFNRFTEFSSSGTQMSTANAGGRFNDIDESMGFNMLHVSVSDQIPAWPDLTFTLFAGGGPTDDQPTKFLQNGFLHKAWGQESVPVDDTRHRWDYTGGGSLIWSREGTPFEAIGGRGRCFIGAGAILGSLYQEPYVFLGGELLFPSAKMKVGVLDRVSWPREGDAFKEVAHQNNLVQFYVGYVPDRLDSSNSFAQWMGNPEFGFTYTYDSGLFVEGQTDSYPGNPMPPMTPRSTSGIDMSFISMRVKWPTGLMFEMWNDIANGTDKGPTMGLIFSVDMLTLAKQRWL